MPLFNGFPNNKPEKKGTLGKRTASGTINSGSSNLSITQYNGTTQATPYVAFDMSLLSFTPSTIQFVRTDKTQLSFAGTWRKIDFYVSGADFANSDTGASLFRVPYVNGVVNIPITGATSTSYSWIAYQE